MAAAHRNVGALLEANGIAVVVGYLDVFEAESMHLNIRSGVAAISPDEVAIVISRQKVNLYAFATFFRDSLRCSDALYLDGSISKLYAPSLGRHEDGEFAAILAVVPKQEQSHIIPGE